MSATCLLETSPRGFPVDSQALGDCKALPTGHRKESGILDGHQVHLTAQCVNVKIISYGPKMVFWCNNSIYLVSLYDIYIIYLFFPSAQLYIWYIFKKSHFDSPLLFFARPISSFTMLEPAECALPMGRKCQLRDEYLDTHVMSFAMKCDMKCGMKVNC